MAGFYQQLVEPMPDYKTRLIAAGRERLRFLRERYGEGAGPQDRRSDAASARSQLSVLEDHPNLHLSVSMWR